MKRAIFLIIIMFFVNAQSAFSQAARQKDATVVAVEELNDVKSDTWAYGAVKELVEKYDVLEGYPDGTFKGASKSTRFELAAAIYDLSTYFSGEIALDREDLAKLAKLLEEFSGEIKAIQGRVDQLEGKVTVLEQRTTTLEGTVSQHTSQLLEDEKRLAYLERRKGFLLERLGKGLVIDVRDFYRGTFSAVFSPFDKLFNKSSSTVTK